VRSLCLLLVAARLLFTANGNAETSTQEKALASRLFDEASKLMAAGQTSAACAKYAESKRLDAQLGTLLYLGECYAKIGKTASAWVSFKEAVDIAAQRSDSRTTKIRERLANIEKALSNLVIVVADSEPADLEIRQDGAVVGRAAWGSPIPIDPGGHEVTATSPTAKPRQVKVDVTDGGQTITVNLPPIEYLPAPVATAAPTAAAAKAEQNRSAPRADDRAWFSKHRKLVAVIAGGVGVAGVGVGAAFGLMVKPTYDKSAGDCNKDVCGSAGHDYRQSAFTKAEVSNIAFGVGAASLIGGAVLWLTAPAEPVEEKPPAARVVPSIGPNIAMLSVQRSW